jgi:solute carrier family 35 (UDP-sugar transporter), member A1/2/3
MMIVYDTRDSDRLAWSGWNGITFLVALLGALGGLLVAASLKYADSILKTLATAGAIIISTVLGHFLLGSPLTHDVILGSCVTIVAILNYTKDTQVLPPSVVIDTSCGKNVEDGGGRKF